MRKLTFLLIANAVVWYFIGCSASGFLADPAGQNDNDKNYLQAVLAASGNPSDTTAVPKKISENIIDTGLVEKAEHDTALTLIEPVNLFAAVEQPVSEFPVIRRQGTEESQQKKEGIFEYYNKPVDPQRLFIVPVAGVLGSMEINTGGGSLFGVSKTDKRPFLGHIRLGLGDVAEIALSTTGIINQLSDGTPSIPTAAFKLKFFSEGDKRPAFTGELRSSLWNSEVRIDEFGNSWDFQKRVSTLFFVFSKTFNKVSLHSGLSINDLRIKTLNAETGELFSPGPEKNKDKDYINRNIFSPFAGIRVEVNPKTLLMMEIQQIPKYEFDDNNPVLSKNNISMEWMMISGIRYYILNWLSIDTGVMYRSDYNGIGDAQIDAGIDFNIPLARVFSSKK